jgi:hypothetical protein
MSYESRIQTIQPTKPDMSKDYYHGFSDGKQKAAREEGVNADLEIERKDRELAEKDETNIRLAGRVAELYELCTEHEQRIAELEAALNYYAKDYDPQRRCSVWDGGSFARQALAGVYFNKPTDREP